VAATARQKVAAVRSVEVMPARFAVDANILALVERNRDLARGMNERNALLEERLDQISSVLEEERTYLDELDSRSGRLAQRVGLEE